MPNVEEVPLERPVQPSIEVPEVTELTMSPEEFAVENEADEARFRSEAEAAKAMLDRFKSQLAAAEENLMAADDGEEAALYVRLKEDGVSEAEKTELLAKIVTLQKELEPLRQIYEAKRQLFERSRAAFETKYGPYERMIQ